MQLHVYIYCFFQNKLKTLASELGRGNAWFQLIGRTGGVNYFCSILRNPVRNHPAAYWIPKQGQFGRAQISINSLPDRPLRFPNLRLVIVFVKLYQQRQLSSSSVGALLVFFTGFGDCLRDWSFPFAYCRCQFYVMFANTGFLFTELRCFSKSRKPNISNIAGVSNLVGNPWRGLHFN